MPGSPAFRVSTRDELVEAFRGLHAADGDGVIVVPVEKAEKVAEIARRILDGDKAGRRKLYEQRGLTPDVSVE